MAPHLPEPTWCAGPGCDSEVREGGISRRHPGSLWSMHFCSEACLARYMANREVS